MAMAYCVSSTDSAPIFTIRYRPSTISPSRPCIVTLPSLRTAHFSPLARSRMPMNFSGIGGGGGGPSRTGGRMGTSGNSGGGIDTGLGGGGGGAFG